jgi:hypothetical protein
LGQKRWLLLMTERDRTHNDVLEHISFSYNHSTSSVVEGMARVGIPVVVYSMEAPVVPEAKPSGVPTTA